ncbi:hypothetical protein RclHR1_12520003 [Rhizophagus clarus]|nr:hypothetical protein RclHR1_12520003 [Rhizophagus clarus]
MQILPKQIRETKQDFYAKREQDAWFTASSFDAVFNLLDSKPKWVIVMSDNRPHYHCSKTMALVLKWAEWYNIECKKWCFLEAGEAKTLIDSHHAQSWLTEGSLAGYVCSHDLLDFREMMTFSISKFTKTDLVQPEPTVDEHSEVFSKWTMPIYQASVSNTDHWDLRRWSQEIGEKSQIGKGLRGDFPKININENQMFHLQLGWALKRNQKYGKKSSGKRLIKEVVAALTHFFMVGQCDPSDRYSAKDMLDGLKEMVENGEITTEVIPSQKTIENWITRFSSLSKKEHAECFLEK